MLSLYRTLSLRYLSRRWFRALLIVASILLGVATLVATQALNDTMSKAIVASSNPMAGAVDLIITKGRLHIERALVSEIAAVPGVKKVQPRVFGQARILIGPDEQVVLLWGVEVANAEDEIGKFADQLALDPTVQKFLDDSKKPGTNTAPQPIDNAKLRASFDATLLGYIPAIFSARLNEQLDKAPQNWVGIATGLKVCDLERKPGSTGSEKKADGERDLVQLVRVASIKPNVDSDLALLGNRVVLLGMSNAAKALGLAAGKVSRIDVALADGADRARVRQALEAILNDRAQVRTIEEQDQVLQSASTGMKTGFSMCGVAALIVGMFLVYNSLAVGVAERRHEIGILLSLGATRDQVWRLFAGEALVLGLVGSALGIPVGLGLAQLGLNPMLKAVSGSLAAPNVHQLEINRGMVALAFVVGILSAVTASLIPAIGAANDRPVDAVRKIPKAPSASHLFAHIGATLALILAGLSMIVLRPYLPNVRWGTFGGLGLVMIGTLLAAPLCAHLVARLFSPLARQFFPIEWRLATDNLVRAPGRTGLVIGALAAGVCLVLVVAGIIRSNRNAYRDWVDSSFAADLIVTSGSLAVAGDTREMDASLGAKLLQMNEIEEALPVRLRYDVEFRNRPISVVTTVADRAYAIEKQRLTQHHDVEMLRRLATEENVAVVSNNFTAHYGVRPGDTITLASDKGDATFRVIGAIVDYSWPLGTVLLSQRDYERYWNDQSVTLFDVYLRPGHDPAAIKEKIRNNPDLGTKYDLRPMTRGDLKSHIDEMIELLFGIAYGQLVVVMLVAGLGMVTALLISVLQRRREMGMLRAIGASQARVVLLVLAEALLMGVVGIVLGALFSLPLQWYALQVVFLEESGYAFPVDVPWTEAGVIALLALTIATLAGLGPALYAVRQRIPEAIAYE